MAESDTERLTRLYHEGVCPYCGKRLPTGKGIGSGRISEGKFCDLDCYTKYYGYELVEKQRKRVQEHRERTQKAANGSPPDKSE